MPNRQRLWNNRSFPLKPPLNGRLAFNATGSIPTHPRFTPRGFANPSDQPVNLIFNHPPIQPEEFLALYAKYDSYPVNAANALPAPRPPVRNYV